MSRQKKKGSMRSMEKTELEKRLEAEAMMEEMSGAEFEPELDTEELEAASAPEEQAADERAALEAERDELRDQLLRARAEFENYRKRMVREADRVRKMAAESLVRDLLPVVDHLELALEHTSDSEGLAEGVSMTLKQFLDVLARNGVTVIPAAGQPFDPNLHEAVTHSPSDETPENVVTQEFQRGYTMGDVVLRPARVAVSAGPAKTAAEAPRSSEEKQEGQGA